MEPWGTPRSQGQEGTQPRRLRRSSQRSGRETWDVLEAKWRKWFQEERVASGGKGCYVECGRTQNRLFSRASDMEKTSLVMLTSIVSVEQ